MSGAGWTGFIVTCALGASTRYLLDAWVQAKTGGIYPWGTWLVNITGCFLLGALTGLVLHHGFDQATANLIGTGFLGSYTTFSTVALQAVLLAEKSEASTAAGYVAASLLAGCAAAGAGLALTWP
ncbi:MAG: CrcB family protein [Actinomycetota bacterium]